MKQNSIFIILIILILFSMISYANTVEHCFRIDIKRNVNSNIYSSEAVCVGADNCGGYDYIFVPGSKYGITEIGKFTYACQNGAGSSLKEFVIMKNLTKNTILGTNSPTNKPGNSTARYCKKNNNICYLSNGKPIPQWPSCSSSSSKIGTGINNEIYYTFNQNDLGENIITTEYPRLPITGASINSMSYNTLNTKKILVANPSFLVLGQGPKVLNATFENTGNYTQEVIFTLLNKSFFENTLVDYNIVCDNPKVTCTIDNSYKNQNFKIKPGNAMIIRGEITIAVEELPLQFTTKLDIEYSAKGIKDCPGTNNGNDMNCNISSHPTVFQIGKLDQQDFQVELIGSSTQTACVGPGGLLGQTGENVTPKINIEFGGGIGEDGKRIQIDECDVKKILDTTEDGRYDSFDTLNENYVYCSQKEFLIELARKIERIAEIKQEIVEIGFTPQLQEQLSKLRIEEANLRSFEAYIREQNFDNESISESIDELNLELFENIGLGPAFTTDNDLLQDRLSSLFNGSEFNTISATEGKYRITIDLNDLVEEGLVDTGTGSGVNLLFPTLNESELNQNLKILLKLEKISNPEFDWFFYKQGNEDISDNFMNIITNADADLTNMRKRGVVLEYFDSEKINNDDYTGNIFVTYAVPAFVKIKGDSQGDTNVSFIVSGDVQTGYGNNDYNSFTLWSGFASTLGEGCSSILNPTGKDPLPFRLPDVRNNILGGTGISFMIEDYAQVTPNSEMFLETVFYLPMKPDYSTGQTANINWSEKDLFFTKSGVCTNPCQINPTLTNYKIDNSPKGLLQNIFDNIKDGNICIHNNITAQGNNWSMFWNQEKILQDLTEAKINALTNSEATECELTVKVS
jgi:hypothetical protein